MKVGHNKLGVVHCQNNAGHDLNLQTDAAKRKINPSAQIRGTCRMRLPPHIVAIQLVTFIPVGTPMIIVAATK